MRTDTPETLPDPQLQQEFEHLYQLLQRIEELAEQELNVAATPLMHDQQPEPETEPEPDIDPEVIEFDPFAFDEPELDPARQTGDTVDEEAGTSSDAIETQEESIRAGESTPRFDTHPSTEDENLNRWWVNFNGELSLERLARLRKEVGDSPFTIETRFEEITDGLIVLRLVTEPHLTLEQVEWIVEQVMQNVGLDRNAAIVSRH